MTLLYKVTDRYKVVIEINVTRIWLKEIRDKKGLSQEDVANQSNIERPYYTMIEQGKRNPSVKVAKNIANTLDFNWTIFFNDRCNELQL